MRRSIFSKIFLGYLIVVCVLAGLILVFSLRAIKDFYQEMVANELKNVAVLMGTEASSFIEKGRFDELDRLVKRSGTRIHTRITFIAPNGIVLADSDENPKTMENHRQRPEVMTALQGKVGTSKRYSSTVNKEMLYVAVPVEKGDKTISVVRTGLFLKDIEGLLGSRSHEVIKIVLVIVLLTLVAALLISNSIAKPVRRLTDAVRKVAEGDLSVRVLLKNKDELKALADGFNRMNERMEGMFSELSGQKEELDSIVGSLQEGLVVVNREGRIIRANESFVRIAGGEPVKDRFFWEVVRRPQFIELMGQSRDEKKSFVKEVPLGERTYLCSVTFTRPHGEIIAVFHDITEIKNVERVKKDFIVNVSHELRTPLTAIKGFAETLLDMVDDPSRKYVEIIERNANRLANIVNDLLLLSNLEEKGTVDREAVDFRRLIDQTVKLFEQRVKEKDLSLVVNVRDGTPPVKVDPFKIEQLLINLLDNAVKYTEQGEIIEVRADVEGRSLVLRVRDTGIGIPREDIPRIFERFYVVDKSRSRKSGGTGLGLSIVKHIVLLHGGTIEVDSAQGEGTMFTVRLPADDPA
ncbi:MAG: Alkaline phosphatase synthesis sensor protein PhoR [Syntrophorhabdaceae bacterium PtaU1.Bin034]|nr:MAG: Alkaline phosphatase synthesis sensor protein PhoR [Syntrophorhabdaceae bacterium PtaU1.Bin034]